MIESLDCKKFTECSKDSYKKLLSAFAKTFPVVAITRSRQSGKTTLARSFFLGW